MSYTRSQIAERVRTIISSQMKVDRERVEETTSLIDDLGGDSLSIVELVMTLETQFEIRISETAAERIRTLADAVACVERHGGPQSRPYL